MPNFLTGKLKVAPEARRFDIKPNLWKNMSTYSNTNCASLLVLQAEAHLPLFCEQNEICGQLNEHEIALLITGRVLNIEQKSRLKLCTKSSIKI